MRILLTTISLCFLLGGTLTAQKTEFKVESSAFEIVTNSTFTVKFTLINGGNGKQFKPPSFGSLKVVGGPNRSSTDRLYNGIRNSERSWTYTLMATKKGEFTIAPAELTIGNSKYRTSPITISVLQGDPKADSEADYRFLMETDTTIYFVGQQILVNYKLLARKSASGCQCHERGFLFRI